jgi:2-keto-4-pentenoate hydratase/2-oxohepta-3-ene-1,7-dioic acid hydratase in catechol pathway
MKITTFEVSTSLGIQRRVGLIDGPRVVDVTAAVALLHERDRSPEAAERLARAETPADLKMLLAEGPRTLDLVREATSAALAAKATATTTGCQILYRLDNVRLLAPIPNPAGIACFIVWESHITDSAAKGFTVAFPKEGSKIRGYYKATPDTVAGPSDPIVWPRYTEALDIECEFAAIVGRKIKDASPEEAAAAIAGYCIFNDVSARDVQKEEMTLGLGPTKGKDMDGGNVFGPYLTTADEVPDIFALTMSVHVNGEKWSSCSTSKMKWGFPDLLSYLSLGQTIYPGQILTSGCYPGGSGLDLGRKINVGDEVELRISGLGSLRNRIEKP